MFPVSLSPETIWALKTEDMNKTIAKSKEYFICKICDLTIRVKFNFNQIIIQLKLYKMS